MFSLSRRAGESSSISAGVTAVSTLWSLVKCTTWTILVTRQPSLQQQQQQLNRRASTCDRYRAVWLLHCVSLLHADSAGLNAVTRSARHCLLAARSFSYRLSVLSLSLHLNAVAGAENPGPLRNDQHRTCVLENVRHKPMVYLNHATTATLQSLDHFRDSRFLKDLDVYAFFTRSLCIMRR